MGIASRLAKKLINGVDILPVKDTSVQRMALRSNLDNSIENKHVSNLEFDARIEKLDEVNTAEEWQKNTKEFVKKSRDVNPTVRTPELENSTLDLLNNKITRKQHLDNVDKHRPVNPWDALPIEPSNKATVFSLKPNQRKDGFFVLPEKEAKSLGVSKSLLAIGQRFLGRLDIPAYKDYDTWIIAGKAPKGEKGTVYAKAIHYTSEDGKPVIFRASQGRSENIGKGKADPNYHPDTHEKIGYATIDGIVKDLDTKTIRAKAEMYLNDPEWVQVGFDPRRQGGFYVRAGDDKHVPVREASEVIQIGPLVLAKNAKLDFEHAGYAEGGVAIVDNEKEYEINSAEYDGKERYVIDFKDGSRLSAPEIEKMFDALGTAPEAQVGKLTSTRIMNYLEKNNPTRDEFIEYFSAVDLNRGGTPMERQMELFNDGGLKDEGGMIDEVSGNDVPVGSTREEVRDDIPAMLSEGEFIFPADVVRFLGLNRLMQLRQEAKMGLKQMEAMGQMGNSEEAIVPDDLPFDVLEIMVTEEDDDDDEPQEKYQGGVLHAARGTFVTPTFDPSNQDVRKYVNADGKTLMIPFLNGNPVYPIPTGYSLVGAAVEAGPAVEPATQSNDDGGGTNITPEPSEFQKAGGWNMDTSAADGKALDLWLKEAEKITTTGNVVVGIIGAINPLVAGAMALAIKKQKKIIEGMLPEKLAQAKKTPIAGQVDTAESITKRLTTNKGKGILATALGAILDPVIDALGFGEEEKEKAKTVASTVAEQDPNESDAESKQAVKKSLFPKPRPDDLEATDETKKEAAAAEEFRADEARSFDDTSLTIAESDKISEAAAAETAKARDDQTESILLDPNATVLQGAGIRDSTLKKVGFDDSVGSSTEDLDQFGLPRDTTPPQENPIAPSLTEPNTLEMPSSSIFSGKAGPITTADQVVRRSIAELVTYGESLDLSKPSLEVFGEDTTSQGIESYLEKAMNSVDAVAQSSTTPPTTATTTAPVQSGGDDDDDGGVFSAPTSNVGDLQGMSTADKTAAVASVTDNLSPTASTGGVELDSALGISGLNRGGFAKRKK
tara:strand:- start:2201 stop:5380 length:3180 start_codon:yes stop_codon:yes gene_type:complete